MFSISITLAPGHAQALLHFKSAESMDIARKHLMADRVTPGCTMTIIRDDYSRTLEVALKDILAVCYSEVETALLSAAESGLLQQQENARLNKKWMGDPLFKSLQTMAQLSAGGTVGGRQ